MHEINRSTWFCCGNIKKGGKYLIPIKMNKHNLIPLLFLTGLLHGCDPGYSVMIYNKTKDTVNFSIGQKLDTLPYATLNYSTGQRLGTIPYANNYSVLKRVVLNDTCLKEPGYFILPQEKMLLYIGNLSWGPPPFSHINYLKIHSKQSYTLINYNKHMTRKERKKIIKIKKKFDGPMLDSYVYYLINN
jgi:hypothetical protein